MEHNTSFSTIIITWYHQHKRDLPWRQTSNPYYIWLSEIILQQTRVDQGLSYYNHFVEQYPNLSSLAQASEDEILKSWQGLGYYSRARNLHKAAKYIQTHFKGEFPKTYQEILSLPGVGPYTAAAISSFAFHLPHPVIDGNVMRVLSRYFGIHEPMDTSSGQMLIAEKATQVFDKSKAHLHNQAIMELGALQCVPNNPECHICPLKTGCRAFSQDMVRELPAKSGKIKIRHRYFHYMIIRSDRKTLVQKRTQKDVWQHLFEFPLIEVKTAKQNPGLRNWLKKHFPQSKIELQSPGEWDKQVLSHQHIHACFYQIQLDRIPADLPENWKVVLDNELTLLPVPKLIERHIHEA